MYHCNSRHSTCNKKGKRNRRETKITPIICLFFLQDIGYEISKRAFKIWIVLGFQIDFLSHAAIVGFMGGYRRSSAT
ncbi:hypothetical protein Hanom_Chr15g01382141 [Helianthus anomalus]